MSIIWLPNENHFLKKALNTIIRAENMFHKIWMEIICLVIEVRFFFLRKIIKIGTKILANGIMTNGNEEKLIRIIKSNPEYLKISVSGFYPDAYNSTH